MHHPCKNLRYKRVVVLTIIFRVSIWSSFLPWPQTWGHIFSVSWLRFKIHSIFYWIEIIFWKWTSFFELWSWNDYCLMRFHHLWKKIRIDPNFFLIWWWNIRYIFWFYLYILKWHQIWSFGTHYIKYKRFLRFLSIKVISSKEFQVSKG